MAGVEPFSDEQARNLVNLRQRYEVWIDAERSLSALPYDLRRKKVGDREYLYEIADRTGNGKSLGPMSNEAEAKLESYRKTKFALKKRRTRSAALLDETCRLCRALRVPLLASEAGEILREADRRSLLGSHLMVVGTNALVAYAIEAGGFIREAPGETEDFDLSWTKQEAEDGQRPLWSMLKAVDATYSVNAERGFQARNARAYGVEILAAPSRVNGMFCTDQPRPMILREQEWLLLGTPVDQIVVCRDAAPARILAPDPRWFALQKLWMSAQPKRNPLKRPKDSKQGMALLDAVDAAMPRFPVNGQFERQIPPELLPHFHQWKATKPVRSKPGWA